jgi:putative flippase GtrA
MLARLFDSALAARFLVVGAVNTAFGYSIILAGLAAGLGDIAANVVGHVLGFGFSYFMHHRFTYRQSGHGRSPLLYLASVLIAFAVNLAVVFVATEKLGLVENLLVHLVAIGCYAVTLYCFGTLMAFGSAQRDAESLNLQRYWPELAASGIWLVALPVLISVIVLVPDVNWQLWIGRHLNAGVPLYDWIMEVNPPLWFWMAQPISALADALQISPHLVLIVAVWLLAGASLALTACLIWDWSTRWRAGLLGSILIGFYPLAISEFGQREHELLLAIVPYAVMIARRSEGKQVPWVLALAVALLVTPMVALKHYFVLVPVALELWLIWRTRRWVLIRPETLTLAAGALVYAGAIVLFAPSYLTNMVPVLSVAYGDLRLPLLLILVHPMNFAAVLCGFYFWHFRENLSRATESLLVVALALFIAYYVQAKGFRYHAEPVIAALTMALGTHLTLRSGPVRFRPAPALLALSIGLMLLGPALISGPYRNINQRVVDQFLVTLEPGHTIAPLTTRPTLLWPMIATADVRLPLRYYHFWMLDSVAKQEAEGGTLTPQLEAFAETVRQQTVEDMLCNPPDTILIDTFTLSSTGFSFLDFFMKNRDFEDLLHSYEQNGKVGFFDIYERIADLPPPTGIECMDIGVGLKSPA